MATLTIPADCGNAPKKAFIRDFIVAQIEYDTGHASECVTEDLRWSLVGESTLMGREAFIAALEEQRQHRVRNLTLDTIITHGDTAAANGTMEFESGERYAFCDIYLFGGHGPKSRIREIASYVIPLKESA